MSDKSRGEFSSSFGFVMAAAGSAIGLGNVWGFPTQTAQNGGAAFVLSSSATPSYLRNSRSAGMRIQIPSEHIKKSAEEESLSRSALSD